MIAERLGRTGRELFDEVQPMGIMSKPQVDVAMHPVAGRAEFITTLRAIEDDFHATGRLPLLQLETHGIYRTDPTVKVADGIGASIADSILWPELLQQLVPLNQATGLRLLVIMASCSAGVGHQDGAARRSRRIPCAHRAEPPRVRQRGVQGEGEPRLRRHDLPRGAETRHSRP